MATPPDGAPAPPSPIDAEPRPDDCPSDDWYAPILAVIIPDVSTRPSGPDQPTVELADTAGAIHG